MNKIKIVSGYIYHHFFHCYSSRPNAVGEIAHFDSLRWEDQEKITKRIAEV